jgi:pilus assembly protein CpaF
MPASSVTAADVIRDEVLRRIEPAAAIRLSEAELLIKIDQFVAQVANERRLLLNVSEQRRLTADIVNDMVGLGPLEVLLRDDTVADILVNGPKRIYVERRGKLELTSLQFRSEEHVLHVAQRIAPRSGGGSTNPAPCSMRAWPTAAASTSSSPR